MAMTPPDKVCYNAGELCRGRRDASDGDGRLGEHARSPASWAMFHASAALYIMHSPPVFAVTVSKVGEVAD